MRKSVESLAQLALRVVALEWGTPAGRLNALGLLGLIILTALLALQGMGETVVALVRPEAGVRPTSGLRVMALFGTFTGLCMVFVTVDDHFRGN